MAAKNEMSWEELQRQVNQYMQQWRKEHPKATLKEIELALDQQMGVLRAKMLQSLALNSSATQPSGEAATPCPNCETPLQTRGKKNGD
jgi:FMN-dependent NADH-azoreductase